MDFGDIAGNVSIPVLSALLLGLMTAISPCPLATNIAAIAYISRRVEDRKHALITGSLYTLGRISSYSIIGIVIIVVGLEVPGVASFLQNLGEQVLGPLLIVVGVAMLLVDRMPFDLGRSRLSTIGDKIASRGTIGGFLLGALFALAFCPYSALLFFGILIPLSLRSTGGVALPAVYAIGTGLPVFVSGALLSAGIAKVSRWLNAVTLVEKIVRLSVALVFIAVGVYYVVLWIQN